MGLITNNHRFRSVWKIPTNRHSSPHIRVWSDGPRPQWRSCRRRSGAREQACPGFAVGCSRRPSCLHRYHSCGRKEASPIDHPGFPSNPRGITFRDLTTTRTLLSYPRARILLLRADLIFLSRARFTRCLAAFPRVLQRRLRIAANGGPN